MTALPLGLAVTEHTQTAFTQPVCTCVMVCSHAVLPDCLPPCLPPALPPFFLSLPASLPPSGWFCARVREQEQNTTCAVENAGAGCSPEEPAPAA